MSNTRNITGSVGVFIKPKLQSSQRNILSLGVWGWQLPCHAPCNGGMECAVVELKSLLVE